MIEHIEAKKTLWHLQQVLQTQTNHHPFTKHLQHICHQAEKKFFAHYQAKCQRRVREVCSGL